VGSVVDDSDNCSPHNCEGKCRDSAALITTDKSVLVPVSSVCQKDCLLFQFVILLERLERILPSDYTKFR